MDCSGPAKYNMWFGPALRYRNRGKYRTADTACFSKISQLHIFGAVLCGIVFTLLYNFFTLFYKTLQNIAGITGIEAGKE